MESNEHEVKAAVTTLSQVLGSALSELAHLRAREWALSEAMKASSPGLYEDYQRHIQADHYQEILDAVSYRIVQLSEVPNKL